ncbi:FAD binding domain-containing protein [Lacisediminimonas profundi]|uniref:FAD binding domain-containing protein n=1 Tax=Lacisediminimonas profundi TaxID=2603856 RepID=UPI00124B0213|nr:FAD binding domain-containing protein [Lacisediminimonas profundi]
MKAASFDYARPTSTGDAIALLGTGAGMNKPVAGGQSLGPMMNLRLAQPEMLIDLRAIAALDGWVDVPDVEPDAIVLGACTTHAAIEDGKVPDPTRGLMPYVARNIAYRAVRNRGTIGGSLAHADPAADWINVMALLDAQYLVTGPGGSRIVGNAGWMSGAFTTALAEDEILTGVRIAKLSASARWSYYKFNRKPGEFAEAIAAFVVDPVRGICRAVIGAIEATPFVIADASPLVDGWNEPFARAQLQAAGLAPDTYEYRIHAVALERAAQALSAPNMSLTGKAE